MKRNIIDIIEEIGKIGSIVTTWRSDCGYVYNALVNMNGLELVEVGYDLVSGIRIK